MNNLRKAVIGLGIASILALQGLKANQLKECDSYEDRNTGCAVIQYYENGNIRSIYPYKNYLWNGVQKEYYENGVLKGETPYKDNKIEGAAKVYYESGKLKSAMPYKNNESHGIAKGYFESGVLQYEKPYKNGKLEGIVKEYYESGKLNAVIPYKNNKYNGAAKAYYNNGELKCEALFQDNKPHSIVRMYYSNGVLSLENTFENGEFLRGRAYNKQGNLEDEIDLVRNVGKVYYNNGRIYMEFKDNTLTYYSDNGTPLVQMQNKVFIDYAKDGSALMQTTKALAKCAIRKKLSAQQAESIVQEAKKDTLYWLFIEKRHRSMFMYDRANIVWLAFDDPYFTFDDDLAEEYINHALINLATKYCTK